MINLFNPKQSSKIGIIKYTESHTGQKKEVDVTKHFWSNSIYPTSIDMYNHLTKNGYTHITDLKWIPIV
jgi:hypothetical protein